MVSISTHKTKKALLAVLRDRVEPEAVSIIERLPGEIRDKIRDIQQVNDLLNDNKSRETLVILGKHLKTEENPDGLLPFSMDEIEEETSKGNLHRMLDFAKL